MFSRWTPIAVQALFGLALACAVATGAHAQTGVFAPIPTISPTTTLSAGHICATDGRDIYCDGTLPLTAGLNITDRIISATYNLQISGTTGLVSLVSNTTTLAYLAPTGFSYLPYLNTLGVSATGTVSGTSGYFATKIGLGTAAGASSLTVANGEIQTASSGAVCMALNAGAIRFTGGALSYCNGTGPTWTSLSSNTAAVQADRIVSGSQAAIINSATGVVSLSTGGTDWGYLNPTSFSYLPYLNTLGVSATGTVSGTNGYFAGNVGIGTTAPSAKLYVASPGYVSMVLDGVNSSSEAQVRFLNATASRFINGFTGDMIFTISNTDVMRVTSASRVALGGGTAKTNLDVSGTIRMTDDGQACNASTGIVGAIRYASGQFYVCRNTTTGWEVLTAGTASVSSVVDRITSGTQAAIINSATGIVSLSSDGGATNWGYLHPSAFSYLPYLNTLGVSATGTVSGTNGYFAGNVAIGKTTANFPLDISGTANVLNNGTTTGYRIARTGQVQSYLFSTASDATYLRSYLSNLYLDTESSAPIVFITSASEAMRLTAGNRLGISTTVPSTTLDVGGTIKTADGGESCNVSSMLGAIRYNSGQFYICRNTTTGWEVLTAGAASVSTALGDRITSGTNAAIINSTTGIISLSTTSGSTSWGYLNPSGLSYLPGLFANQVSSTNVSLTVSDYASGSVTITTLVGAGGNQIVSGTSNVTVNGGSVNTVSFTTGGTQRMVLTNTGLGISVTTPAYALEVGSSIRMTNGEIIAANALNSNQFRMVAGNYGALLHNDGNSTYILMTASGDQYGSWTNYRPLVIADTGATVQIGGGGAYPTNLSVGGNLDTTAGYIHASSGYRNQNGSSGSVSGNLFNVYWTGGNAQLWIDTTNIGNITVSSDRRIKHDIETLPETSGLAALSQINPVSFHWNDKKSGTELQYGFIAQEVRKVFPNLVRNTGMKTKATPDGLLRVEYNGFFAPIVKGIQELKALFDTDHAALVELQQQNADLRALVAKQGAAIDALLKTNPAAAAKVGQQH